MQITFLQIDPQDPGLNIAAKEGHYEIDNNNLPVPENNPSIPNDNILGIAACITEWGH